MNTILRKPVFYLGACLLLLPMIGMTQAFLVPPWVLRLVFLLIVLPLLVLVICLFRRELQLPLNNFVLALLGVVALAGVAAIYSINIYDAWYGAIKWLCFLLLVILAYNCIEGDEDKNFLIKCMAFGGLFMALIGIAQYLYGLEFYMTSTHKYSWPSATSAHKNQASTFVVLTFPLAFYLAFSANSRWKLYFWSMALAAMSVFLVYGRARQAFVALAVEMLFFLVVFRVFYKGKFGSSSHLGKYLPLNFLLCVFVFVGLTIMPPVGDEFSLENSAWGRLMERGESYQRNGLSLDTASNGRLKTWKNTLPMLSDSVFLGKGYLNWQVEYPKYSVLSADNYNLSRSFYWRYTHNDYLQTLVEFGFISIFFAVLLLIGLGRSFRFLLNKEKSCNGNYASLSLMVGLVGLAVAMFFSFPLSMTLQPAYASVYLGVISALGKDSGVGGLGPFRSISVKAPVLVAPCIVLAVAGAWFGYGQSLGWHHAFKGENSHRHIEEKLADIEKYPDVTPYREKIYSEVMASVESAPFNPTLDIRRGGLLSYLAITEKDEKKKAFYYRKSQPFMDEVKGAFPYYELPYVVEEMYWRSVGDSSLRIPALFKAMELAPGDVELTRLAVDYYFEQKKLDKLYFFLEGFFQRFYDSQLLDVYVYAAQETHNQARAIANIENIDLVKRDSTYRDEKLLAESKKIRELRGALLSQISGK